MSKPRGIQSPKEDHINIAFNFIKQAKEGHWFLLGHYGSELLLPLGNGECWGHQHTLLSLPLGWLYTLAEPANRDTQHRNTGVIEAISYSPSHWDPFKGMPHTSRRGRQAGHCKTRIKKMLIQLVGKQPYPKL